jgi:hypothetical protein
LVRSAHDLDGILDVTPLLGLLGVAPALSSLGVPGRLGDGPEAMPLEHLPRDYVNLHLRHHVALPMVGFPCSSFCSFSWRRQGIDLHRGPLPTSHVQPAMSNQPCRVSFLSHPHKTITKAISID